MPRNHSPLIWLVPLVILVTAVIDVAVIANRWRAASDGFDSTGDDLVGTLATSLTDAVASGNYQALERSMNSFVDQHEATYGLLRDRDGAALVSVAAPLDDEGRPAVADLPTDKMHQRNVTLPDGRRGTEFSAVVMLAGEAWAGVTVAFPRDGVARAGLQAALITLLVSVVLAIAVLTLAYRITVSQRRPIEDLARKASEALDEGEEDGLDALDRILDRTRQAKVREQYQLDEATDAFATRALQPGDVIGVNRDKLSPEILAEATDEERAILERIGDGASVDELIGEDPAEGLDTYRLLSRLTASGLLVAQGGFSPEE